MTHEPIRVIHFSPHVTWQGTQAELDAMLAEGWPDGSDIIAACKRDVAKAEAYAAELEAKALANRVTIMRLQAKLRQLTETGKPQIKPANLGAALSNSVNDTAP